MPPTRPGETADHADGRRFRTLPSRPETPRHQDHGESINFLSVFSSLIENRSCILLRLTGSTVSGIPITKEFLGETLVSFASSWFIVWVEIPNPPAAAEADQASSERGGHEPPAGDGATRRPEADSKFEIRNP